MNTHYLGKYYVYIGGCYEIRVPPKGQKDVVRGEELIEGNKYKLIGAMGDCINSIHYLKVKNEYKQDIYVPDIYFKEYIN